MTIRPGKLADVPALVDLGAQLHRESTFSHLSFKPEKVDAVLGALIGGEGPFPGVVYLSEQDGRLVGAIAGAVVPFWFGDDLQGADIAFYVLPAYRLGGTALRLLLCLESWCKLKGACEMRISTAINAYPQTTGRLYAWAGYTQHAAQHGTLFTKSLRDEAAA